MSTWMQESKRRYATHIAYTPRVDKDASKKMANLARALEVRVSVLSAMHFSFNLASR